jgi:hypothetical protein
MQHTQQSHNTSHSDPQMGEPTVLTVDLLMRAIRAIDGKDPQLARRLANHYRIPLSSLTYRQGVTGR